MKTSCLQAENGNEIPVHSMAQPAFFFPFYQEIASWLRYFNKHTVHVLKVNLPSTGSTSFPGSLILPSPSLAPGGGKMRDTGNEVGTGCITIHVAFNYCKFVLAHILNCGHPDCAVTELTKGPRKKRKVWGSLFQGDLRSGEKRLSKFLRSQSVTGE